MTELNTPVLPDKGLGVTARTVTWGVRNGTVITSRLALPLNTPPPAKPVAISRMVLLNLRTNRRNDYLEFIVHQFLSN